MDIKSFWPELGPSIQEASVYLDKYKNKKIILKYGGQVMSDLSLSKAFAQDAAILRKLDVDVAVIHGGGPQIKTKLESQNLESKFISGLRVTDKNVIKVVEDVLLNEINPDLRDAIINYGAKAESVTVRKNNVIHIDKSIDEQLGFVGDPKKIDTKVLNNFFKQKIIPVIAPMGMDNKGQVYNVNADTAAGTIANQIKAERLLLMTDVPGVNDKDGNLISQLSTKQALDLIDDGTITGGMIPKIKTCISAIESGVNGVVIIDGRKSHAVLFELFSNLGAGTLIVK
ncbi:K00930 argB; acetylglutamate kinase [Candidatus Pelagibacterales bacterium]|jgi:acetylglutamate kinase